MRRSQRSSGSFSTTPSECRTFAGNGGSGLSTSIGNGRGRRAGDSCSSSDAEGVRGEDAEEADDEEEGVGDAVGREGMSGVVGVTGVDGTSCRRTTEAEEGGCGNEKTTEPSSSLESLRLGECTTSVTMDTLLRVPMKPSGRGLCLRIFLSAAESLDVADVDGLRSSSSVDHELEVGSSSSQTRGITSSFFARVAGVDDLGTRWRRVRGAPLSGDGVDGAVDGPASG